jgi:hypothetical protein
MTEEQLTNIHSAMLDSVDVIDGVIAGTQYSPDPQSAIVNNQRHLQLMIGRHDFGDRDFTEINRVLAIDADTVEITPYVDQADVYAARQARTIEARDFMDRFTPQEKLDIVGLTQSSAQVKLWYDEALAGRVWLDHPDVDAGLSAVVALGKLTAERKAEIIGV